MSAPNTTADFRANAAKAVRDPVLQKALGNLRSGFQANRARARAALPEFDALRDAAVEIKEHSLDHLDLYLERFEAQVIANGGQVHWCRDAAEARAAVRRICDAAGARNIIKGKSMVTEEIGLNDDLAAAGLKVLETDLGEYIIQLRDEMPSHLIAPAVHLTREQVADSFTENHDRAAGAPAPEAPDDLLAEARRVLRREFLDADLGITGANFLIAETGAAVIVTNEGNGDLSRLLPDTHIVVTGIEKVVPTQEDAATLLRLLARSASGQELSAYTTFAAGPARPGDADGPAAFHVVLVDNGRSRLLGGEFRDILRCIRCGACLNHCPVYGAIGGHAYGWVYSGPIGAVLTPALLGLEGSADLPAASSLCGRCEAVCPTRVPLPELLRRWRRRSFAATDPAASDKSPAARRAYAAWGWLARRPRLYGVLLDLAARGLHRLGGRRGYMARLPFAGGWTAARDLPAPEGRGFQALWAKDARARTAAKPTPAPEPGKRP